MQSILIVEDEISLLNILADEFAREGLDVLKAQDGKQGLRMALKEKPDVILLDIVMPVMDGLTMLQKLRKDPWGKKADVILLTNVNNPTMIEKGQKEGALYALKAWPIMDIIAGVRDRLKKSRAGKKAAAKKKPAKKKK